MGIEVRGLKEVKSALGRLRGAVRVPTLIIDLPQAEADKVEWLVRGRPGVQKPRDLLALTPKLVAEMATALSKGLAKVVLGKGTATEAWRAAGEAYRKRLENRIGFSGGDLASKLAPLKASTVAAKGGNTRLFYKSGALYRAIKAATVTVKWS